MALNSRGFDTHLIKVADLSLKIEEIGNNVENIEELFDSKLNVVDERICQALDDKMSALGEELETKIEHTYFDRVEEDILSKHETLEINTNTILSEKVVSMQTLIIEKISDLSNHLKESEDRIKQRIMKVNLDAKNIMENLNEIDLKIDDIEEGLYDFDMNKKNNLIFYGIRLEENMNLTEKIDNVLKEYLNIGRKLALKRVSIIKTGNLVV